jgi:histidinol-phosphate aminotransferase
MKSDINANCQYMGVDIGGKIRPGVMGLPDYVPGEYREGYAKLASNENNYGPSPHVVAAIRLWSARTQLYPYLDGEVRERLAAYAGVKAGGVVLGNGSDELMDMLVKVFEGPVAGSYPSFSEYPIAAGAVGERYVSVPLEDDFTFNEEKFLEEAAGCNLAFLCSPNNPTGISITDDAVRAVLEAGMVVVLDEAYYEFSGKTRAKWLKKYPNLIILRTLSKAFALAGLRIGYALAGPEVAKAMLKVKIPFNVNSLAQAAALAALGDVRYSHNCVKKIVKDRERIYKALSAKYKAYPSESNFVLADVRPMTAKGFFDGMLAEGIIVRKFGKFQGYPGEYVRVSPGTKDETERFIEALGRL